MMQRLVDLKFHLQRVSYLIEDARIITKLADLAPTDDEWETIVCLIAMLKPFYQATNKCQQLQDRSCSVHCSMGGVTPRRG